MIGSLPGLTSALCAYGACIGHASPSAPEVERAAVSPGAGTRRDSSQASRSRSKIPRRLLPSATMAGPSPIESSRSMERRVRLARFAASSKVNTIICVLLVADCDATSRAPKTALLKDEESPRNHPEIARAREGKSPRNHLGLRGETRKLSRRRKIFAGPESAHCLPLRRPG